MALIGDLDAAGKAALVTAVAGRITGTVLGREAPASAVLEGIAESAIDYLIDRAPRTPESIGREAAVRFGGWIFGNRPNVTEQEWQDPSGTAVRLKFAAAATANGFKASGAGALVARFIRRRAGAINDRAADD